MPGDGGLADSSGAAEAEALPAIPSPGAVEALGDTFAGWAPGEAVGSGDDVKSLPAAELPLSTSLHSAQTLTRQPMLSDSPMGGAGSQSHQRNAPFAVEAPRLDRHAVFARGGMSEVWTGMQRSLGRVVAIKMIRRDAMKKDDPQATNNLERSIRREAFVASMLEHPAIVPVYDFVESPEGGDPQLVMRMVRGHTWSDDLRLTFPELDLPAYLARHLNILHDVALAIAYAHSKGIIHRDLKPSQVMLGEFGEVQVLDWGMAARVVDETVHPSLQLLSRADETSAMEGTPAYMAPEQARRESPYRVGTHTDVYQLGGILYQILCGQPPHSAPTTVRSIELASAGVVTPPSEVVGRRRFVPPELESLAMRCLSINPHERLASARLVAEAVSDYLVGNTRRRRAQAMIDEANGLLINSRAGYAPLSKAISLLEEASGLWPENADIASHIEQTTQRMAQLALQLGDLSMAEAMATRLANDDTRKPIEEACRSERRIRQQREHQRRVSLVAAGVFAGLTVLIGLGWLAYRMESQRRSAELAFARRATEARAALASKLDHHLETVRSVALLFTINPGTTRRDFSVFVTPIVERHPGIYALEWCPMITHEQRAAYEAAFAAENLGNTQIIEPDASGNLVRAPDRDVYFPVHFAEPLEVNLPIMGLDAGFSPERRRAFDDARDRASDVATSRITLVEETGNEFAVLVAVPSYRDGMPLNTPLDRRAAFQGFSVALWRMGDLLQAALEGQVSARSTYLLWDASARSGEELLATFRPSEAAPPVNQTAGIIYRREPMSFAGRSWVLEVREWPG